MEYHLCFNICIYSFGFLLLLHHLILSSVCSLVVLVICMMVNISLYDPQLYPTVQSSPVDYSDSVEPLSISKFRSICQMLQNSPGDSRGTNGSNQRIRLATTAHSTYVMNQTIMAVSYNDQ